MRSRSSVFGFSLIELLVSISILSLVVSLLYGGFFQISNYSLDVQKSLEGRQELRLLMKMILDDLQAVKYLQNVVVRKERSRRKSYETGIKAERIGGMNPQEQWSQISFHAAIPNRFFPEAGKDDPNLHEIGYRVQFNEELNAWQLLRREDFYIDSDIREGGKEYVLSERVVNFRLKFLENQVEKAERNVYEGLWSDTWETEEHQCEGKTTLQKNSPGGYCLPKAIRLTLGLKGDQGQILEDTMEINLCVFPCNPKIFPKI